MIGVNKSASSEGSLILDGSILTVGEIVLREHPEILDVIMGDYRGIKEQAQDAADRGDYEEATNHLFEIVRRELSAARRNNYRKLLDTTYQVIIEQAQDAADRGDHEEAASYILKIVRNVRSVEKQNKGPEQFIKKYAGVFELNSAKEVYEAIKERIL